MTASPPPTENWISPASSELTTRDAPPPMMITSASSPCFLNRPFSSATQIEPDVALTELKPIRTLSWARAAAAMRTRKTTLMQKPALIPDIDDLQKNSRDISTPASYVKQPPGVKHVTQCAVLPCAFPVSITPQTTSVNRSVPVRSLPELATDRRMEYAIRGSWQHRDGRERACQK